MKQKQSAIQSDYDRHFLNQIGHGHKVDYTKYFQSQIGNGSIPVYQGLPVQHGYGLGNFIASAFRRAVPLLKRGAMFLGRKLLNTGSKIVTDVASGIPVKTSVQSRGKDAARDVVINAADEIAKMTGNGHKRKCKRRRQVSSVTNRKKRRPFLKPSDIFSTI